MVKHFPDSWRQIKAENQFNDPPEPGTQFYMVTLKAKNVGPSKAGLHTSYLRTVGTAVGWVYTPFGDSCGVIPNDLYREVLPTFETEINVCWQVASKDLPTLMMFWESLGLPGEHDVWFSLGGDSVVAVGEQPTPVSAPTLLPVPTPTRPQPSANTVEVEGIRFRCDDLLAEYDALAPVIGSDAAVTHVSNVMNLRALESGKYVSIGQASRALSACGR